MSKHPHLPPPNPDAVSAGLSLVYRNDDFLAFAVLSVIGN